jgi:hypothetical protein
MENETDFVKIGDTTKLVQFKSEGDMIEGIYIGIEPSLNFKDSWALKYEDSRTGDKYAVFVNKLVYDRITVSGMLKGMCFRLIYTGDRQSVNNPKFKYKTYDLFVRK